MKKKTKIIVGIGIFVVIIIFSAGSWAYYKLAFPCFNVKETVCVYIDKQKDFNDLLLQLQIVGRIKDVRFFKQFSNVMKYPERMKTGRYAITPQISCTTFLQNLIRGNQTPVNLTFNGIRLKSEFAERIDLQLMLDKNELLCHLNDSSVCSTFGFDVQTIDCMFIPNTYSVYWNISVDRFLNRMKKEYDQFWTSERLDKAAQIPLTPIQVSILASIVEEESATQAEYPVIAGLYINRLKRGMLLQSDPTVKYAVGDFTLKRILFAHLETDSPYNTYKHAGLPPGPIRIPTIKGIDAVLNYTHHDYLYMCAKEDFSGQHHFATTLAEHTLNARRYQQALNRNNIR